MKYTIMISISCSFFFFFFAICIRLKLDWNLRIDNFTNLHTHFHITMKGGKHIKLMFHLLIGFSKKKAQMNELQIM